MAFLTSKPQDIEMLLTHSFLWLMQVLEETGFDVTNLLNKDEYIEMIFGQQRVRLYVIAGVKDDTSFAPLTKKEISVMSSVWAINYPLEFRICICYHLVSCRMETEQCNPS